MKFVNNLIGTQWARIYAIQEEDYYGHNGNTADGACFVMAVTFLNIIYLLKFDEK